MVEYLKNVPKGPLDHYRNTASFDWKKMKQTLFSNGAIKFEALLYQEIAKYPELIEYYYETPVLDQLRHTTLRKAIIQRLIEEKYRDELEASAEKQFLFHKVFVGIDVSSAIKWIATHRMFANTIKWAGTKKHEHLLEKANNLEIIGCFGLTEVGHGSDAKEMRLTATYDIDSKQFILHSKDFLAAKCWMSNLGKSAIHMLTFAKLITPDGVDHGLHNFVVPIRDPKTHLVYSGIIVLDLGEKIGCNGADTGLAMFNNYRIPYDSLLNKFADVTQDGHYKTIIKDPTKRFVSVISQLLPSRNLVMNASVSLLTNAITIAIRYASIRKQFSMKANGEESSILEYQIHQYRLLPYLASAYAFNICCKNMVMMINDNVHENGQPEIIEEIHAIMSGLKPLISANARDGIQECREACGGHGYLKASGLGHLRNDNDVTVTGEGDNHVLIQQTTKWLLKFWPLVIQKQRITSPLGYIGFLNNAEDILNSRCNVASTEDITATNHILLTFEWLICYLLKTCYISVTQKDTTVNSVYMKNLAIVYTQYFVLSNMYNAISQASDVSVKAVLEKLFSLYGIFNLSKQVPVLYVGQYARGPNTVKLMDEAVLKLCAELKSDAVSLVDAIALPDNILKSVLGNADGQVYKHLEDVIVKAPGASARPTWWKEIIDWKTSNKSKI